uniref:Antitoxin n=1 Tax=Myoviridae sp. ctgr818 TaxID=2825150 RepID=A0A8S5PCD3_9CAUD|nr:MAG TPA: antitoxin [Myoviridae sp. ctgr818]DAP11188.1 MAG TPA: antitoxin [Caudoviricetes sp.]
MLQYALNLLRTDEGSIIIRFRDISEIILEVWSDDEILSEALNIFKGYADFARKDNEKIILPTEKPQKDDLILNIPISLAAKILLLNTMIELKIKPVDLARKMNVQAQDLTRLLSMYHYSKIDTIELALNALGKKLALSIA